MSTLAAFSERLFPKEKLHRKFLRRIRSRRGDVSLPFSLEYRHIYVLPTAFGLSFGVLLLFMALGGLNFSNNMALLLVFILATVAQLTTLLAYRNLVGISIDSIQSEPVFCGEPAVFRIYLGNPEARPRLVVQAGFASLQDCTDLDPEAGGVLSLREVTEKRGWMRMSPFRLETRYPLGMFRAWSWFFPEARCLVYPRPARRPPPLPKSGSGPTGQARKGEGEQVHGLREYRPGDSPRRIAWRSSARHDNLYTREMEEPRDNACEIAWDALAGTGVEARISILTAWVMMADHRQIAYSLEIPGHSVPADQGIDHRHRCLELLALYSA
jgi:uncharacterized protein (DUF58 family)